MRKINIILSIILIIIILLIMQILELTEKNYVYAAGNNASASDVQLMARAINGEARGEPYEGQVAVRCSYIKQSKAC